MKTNPCDHALSATLDRAPRQFTDVSMRIEAIAIDTHDLIAPFLSWTTIHPAGMISAFGVCLSKDQCRALRLIITVRDGGRSNDISTSQDSPGEDLEQGNAGSRENDSGKEDENKCSIENNHEERGKYKQVVPDLRIPPTNGFTPLLNKLVPEIRVNIYELLILNPTLFGVQAISKEDNCGIHTGYILRVSILRTCHRIFAEVENSGL